MIFSRLHDFQQYIQSEVKVSSILGAKDVGGDQKPYVRILPENEFSLFTKNEKTNSIDFPVTVKTIGDKGNEQKALEVFGRLLQKINQFFPHEGHLLEGSGSTEYVEDTKTFEISILYTLKLFNQDTA